MHNRIEFEQEEDGRWIAETPALPGVMAYGATQLEAELKVQQIAHHVTHKPKRSREEIMAIFEAIRNEYQRLNPAAILLRN